jgi:DNA-binding IclR family transcriptional regulator
MAKSALRVLEIMEHIADQRQGANHTQISQQLKIPKSSLSALLKDLQTEGYISVEGDSGRYTIGSQVLALSNAYLRNLNLVRVGQPVVNDVFGAVGEFTALGIRKNNQYVIVCAEIPTSPLAHSLQIGEHGPLLPSATGKVMLAFMSEAEKENTIFSCEIQALTQHTKMQMRDVRAELVQIRNDGIAYSREEALLGITAIAAPVFNATGIPIAGLSVALPTARLTAKLDEKIQVELRRGARRLSEALGWRD